MSSYTFEDDDLELFTSRVKAWIDSRGVKIKDLAERLDIKAQTLSNWLNSGIPGSRTSKIRQCLHEHDEVSANIQMMAMRDEHKDNLSASLAFKERELTLMIQLANDLDLSLRDLVKFSLSETLKELSKTSISHVKERAKAHFMKSFKTRPVLNPISPFDSVEKQLQSLPLDPLRRVDYHPFYSNIIHDSANEDELYEIELLGAAAAGSGIDSDHLGSVMLRHEYPDSYKAIKVVGDSMDDGSEISIKDGCYAIVNPNWSGKPFAVKNRIYAWNIDGGEVLKKFVRRKVEGKTQGFLESLNLDYKPILYTDDMIPQAEFVAVEC